MKNIILLVLVTLSFNAFSEVKVGVINIQQVLDSIKEGKSVNTKIKKAYDKKKVQVKNDENKLRKKRDELLKKASFLSKDARMKKEKELQENFLKLQQKTMEYQKDIQKLEANLKKPILEKVKKIVDQVSKEAGVDFTVEVSASPVVYVKSQIELTKKVISIYDKKHK